MGLSPEAARGVAVRSRTAGLVAAAVHESRDPQAMDYWQLIQERTDYVPPGSSDRTEP